MTRGDFLAAYNIGHRDGKEDVYCPNDYDDIFNIEQEPCEKCCNGNQEEKAKLCQKSYIAGMEHNIKVSKDGQPSEDCISRKAVLDALHSYFAEGFNEDRWWNSTYVLNAINKVPSIVPQPKTEGARDEKVGHWEWVQYDANPNIGNWHCSECSCILRGETNKGPVRLPKYCPDCGAKMEVDK
jgi:hypothetical protein